MDLKVEITGKIDYLGAVRGDSFKVKPFIIHVPNKKDPKYDEYFTVEATRDQIPLIEGFAKGDDITVTAFLSGRKWVQDGNVKLNKNREPIVFTSLRLYTVEGTGSRSTQSSSQAAPTPPINEDTDDLPF